MSRYYPVNLDLRGRRCLIIGGGSVAYRKARSLVPCGAQVEVASRILSPPLQKMVEMEQVIHLPKDYEPSLLEGVFIVISATNDRQVNRCVAEDAAERNLLVNVVDCPELCNFIVPAVVERGPLTISVSTGGSSPALARAIREELEKRYGPEFEEMVEYLGKIRSLIISRFPDQKQRHEIFSRLGDPALAEFFRRGERELVEEKVLDIIDPDRKEGADHEKNHTSGDEG